MAESGGGGQCHVILPELSKTLRLLSPRPGNLPILPRLWQVGNSDLSDSSPRPSKIDLPRHLLFKLSQLLFLNWLLSVLLPLKFDSRPASSSAGMTPNSASGPDELN
jgi:hypothetical protein